MTEQQLVTMVMTGREKSESFVSTWRDRAAALAPRMRAKRGTSIKHRCTNVGPAQTDTSPRIPALALPMCGSIALFALLQIILAFKHA